MRLESQDRRDRLAGIYGRHQLANAVNQNIAIMNGRQAIRGGLHLYEHCPMFIAADAVVRFRGQRKDWMFHRRHVRLGRGVHQVTNEEVRSGRRGGRSLAMSVIAADTSILHTPSQANSILHTPASHFDISPTGHRLRWFTHRFSIVYTPIFDSLHTGRSRSENEISDLTTAIHSVTQYVTQIFNTQRSWMRRSLGQT
jgi:hypothetical protein